MKKTKRVSSTVDEGLLERALDLSGETQAETIRRALAEFVNRDALPASAPTPPSASAMSFSVPQAAATPAAATPPVAALPVSEMTEDELLNTEEALFAARRGLNKAIMLLEAKASNPSPPPGVDAVEETKRINREVGDLEKRVFDIGQKINALDAKTLSMTPPDAATVRTIGDLTDTVGRMTAAASETDQIIAVARQIAGSLGDAAA